MLLLTILVCVVHEVSTAKEDAMFDYSFPVHATERCPMNSKESVAASDRLRCNETHGYHCVPDKTFSSLIEFCYPEGKLKLFQKGNCLELAYTGILNHVKCSNFTCGCPDQDYKSNEIYNYPACLSVYENCFTADINCLKMRSSRKEQKALEQGREEGYACTVYIVFLSVICVLFIVSVAVFIIKLYKNQQLIKRMKRNMSYEENPLLHGQRMDTDISGNKGTDHLMVPDKIGRYIFVDFTIEDAQLFDLLKRQCLNGVYVGFKYLVENKVITRKKIAIFHQRDVHGCTLLHYAAQGGSITILKTILKTDSEAKLENRCYRGQNALHFAIKYKQREMSEYLITEYGKNLMKCSTMDFNQSSQERGMETAVDSTDHFEPFHWIAWNGDLRILEVLKEANADLSRLTRNGLSILDIACMKKENNFCKHVIENEKQIDLEKVDASGWNIAHYAALSDNVQVFDLLKNEHKHLINAKTYTNKTSLQIACEYGSRDTVTYLMSHFQSLLKCRDDHGWNALHFAAKGGNLEILKELLKTNRIEINSLTEEGKTLLHVACIHKHVDICKYVADKFFQDHRELLDQKTTNHGWSAAHYVGVERKGDGSEVEIIDILHEHKMDLSAKTKKGYSLLDIAVDHCNTELIEHIVSSKYRTDLDITEEWIRKAKENTKNEQVLRIFNNALSEISEK